MHRLDQIYYFQLFLPRTLKILDINDLKRKVVLIFVMLVTGAAGCTTTQSVPANPTSVSSRIEVGDSISIRKRDGDVVELEVTRMTRSGIHGNGQYVAYADMREIHMKEFDGAKTAGLVGVIGAGIIVIREGAKQLGNAVASQSFR